MRTHFLACVFSFAALGPLGCGDNGDTGGGDSGSHPETGDAAPGKDGAGEDATGDAHTGDGGTGDATNGDGAGPDGSTPADPSKGAWRRGFRLRGLNGVAAQASAMILSPDRTQVYVGGTFTDAGGTAAQNVAVWTGSAWNALGGGLPGPVQALAFGPDGALYAGGIFTTASVPHNSLARWDGSTWTMLPGDLDGTINALAVQGSRLLVGGSFSHAGTVATTGIAAYANQAWSAVGTTGTDAQVQTLLVKDAKAFCMGGDFSKVDGVSAAYAACWNGMAWTPLGTSGLTGPVSRLVQGPDGTYYVGGVMSFVIDPANFIAVTGLGILVGQTWQPFAGGVTNGFTTQVRALAFAPNGDLLVGGDFSGAGYPSTVGALNLARYSVATKTWSELGGGVSESTGGPGINVGVYDIQVLADGSFLVGGIDSEANHQVQLANVGRLQNATWTPLTNSGASTLGVDGYVNRIASDKHGGIVVGGSFVGADGVTAPNIARLGTSGWEALGAGTDGSVADLCVRAAGDIVVGGAFQHAGAVATPYLARWDGSTWSALGPALDASVDAIAEDAHANLYVGGDFTHAGGVAANRVARWDGTGWSALGAGFDGTVYSLAVDAAGGVIAVGSFTNAGSVAVHGIARWDGSAWAGFGAGFSGAGLNYGQRVIADGAGFVVAGAFSAVDGHPVSGLARWDGSSWSAFGKGLSTASGGAPIVFDVFPYRAGVFATGVFDGTGGDTSLAHIGWFDGTNWLPLDTGLNDLGGTLLVDGNTLWVGGAQVTAGSTISNAIGAWDFGG
jgi:hypothetical protein